MVALSSRLVFFALNLVARELGDVPTYGPDRYDATVQRLRRRRALVGLLPTSHQLTRWAGDWDAALMVAGLAARSQAASGEQMSEGEGAHRAPAVMRRAQESVSVPDALMLYLEHQGSLAPAQELRWFAAEAGFAVADATARPWGEWVVELRTACAAAGRWCPPRPVPASQRVRYDLPAEGLPGLPPRRERNHWTRQRCIDAVVSYWDQLPAGAEPKQKPYGAWAVGKDDYPAPSRFAKHGGFARIRNAARAARLKRAKLPPVGSARPTQTQTMMGSVRPPEPIPGAVLVRAVGSTT